MRAHLIIAVLLSAVTASAATGTSKLAHVVLQHRARTGETLPMFVKNRELEATGRVPVVVEFSRAPSPSELATLESRGVHWLLGREMVSGAHLASVDEPALVVLESSRIVTRVSVDLPLVSPRPLDKSAVETRIDTARRALRKKDGTLLDGTGTTIGDVDSGIFVFHPALFRADGGTSRWVDVDADGTLTPDVDGVDLDASGSIEPSEVLHVIRANAVDYHGVPISLPAAPFMPDRDFLYCDTDGNGKRDYGKAFSEDTPAYGEPLFVFDDANGDGKTTPSERVVRLKTSKVKAVHRGSVDYVRGGTGSTGLSRLDYGLSPDALVQMFHGTGVAGILVSGNPGISKWLGLAPNADLVMGVDDQNGTAQMLQWALFKGANVLLTEYAPWVGVSLDGSSPDDNIIDAAFTSKNVVTASPAGNLALSKKHRTISLSANTPFSIPIPTDQYFQGAQYLGFSTHHRSTGRMIAMKLTAPGLPPIDVPANAQNGLMIGNGMLLYTESQTTSRGTNEQHLQLVRQGGLPLGAYGMSLTVDAGPDVEADVYVIDGRNSWERGAQFDSNTPTRTICEPATADNTISVAAYTLHDESAYNPSSKLGELASYSSRGPLLDGTNGIRIGAPDNPLSLAPPYFDPNDVGTYMPFGGTSGAGPHVAASLALLRQLFPSESAAQIKERVLSSARHDAFATQDALSTFGHGKLDVGAAAMLDIASGKAPIVRLTGPAKVQIGAPIVMDAKIDDDGPASELAARWDLDYDGVPDTGWETVVQKTVTAPLQAGFFNAKIEVRDSQGNVSADTILVEMTDAPAPMPSPTPNPMDPPKTQGGCGCVTSPSPPNAAWLALGLLWLLGRRRRA